MNKFLSQQNVILQQTNRISYNGTNDRKKFSQGYEIKSSIAE